MKGVELPVNVLVIVAVAVLVLLGLITLFMTVFGGGGATITLGAVKQQACAELLNAAEGCGAADPGAITVQYDADRSGTVDDSDTLQELCENYYGCDSDDKACCRRVCACPQIPA